MTQQHNVVITDDGCVELFARVTAGVWVVVALIWINDTAPTGVVAILAASYAQFPRLMVPAQPKWNTETITLKKPWNVFAVSDMQFCLLLKCFSVLFSRFFCDGRNKTTLSRSRNGICLTVLFQFYFSCAGTIAWPSPIEYGRFSHFFRDNLLITEIKNIKKHTMSKYKSILLTTETTIGNCELFRSPLNSRELRKTAAERHRRCF